MPTANEPPAMPTPSAAIRNLRIGVRVGRAAQVATAAASIVSGVDDAAAILVGPDAEDEADQRAGQDRRADQQAELGLVQPEVLLDLDADDREPIRPMTERPDLGDRLPAIGNQHERRDEFGHGGADIAGAEDAKRGALLARRVEARDVGDADRERAAGDADKERRDQEFGIGVRPGQQVSGDRRGEHDDGVDPPPAILVGPDAEHQADQRSAQDGGADQQAELGIVQPEFLLDPDADDREDRPDRKADRERNGRKPECPALMYGA